MFLDLAPELLVLVARHLPYSSDRLHLAACCCRLRETVLHEAYVSIDVHRFCEKSLRRLVEILLDRSDVAKQVTCISLSKSVIPPCKSHPFNSDHSDLPIRQSVSDLIQKFAPSNIEYEQWMAVAVPKEEYKEECSLLGQDLWLSMLLNCVPNIKYLEMEWGGYTDISERFLAFVSLNHGFQGLKEATVKIPFESGSEFQLYKLAPFFRLPSMRKFKGVMITDIWSQDKVGFGNLVPPASSPIEHIEMAETSATNGFMPLVRACRRLRSFTYLGRESYEHFGDLCDLDHPPINYNTTHFLGVYIDELSDSLALAKDSLEHICIDMYYPEREYMLGWFGSLAQYTTLKTLHLRLRDLLHINFETNGISYNLPTYVALPDILPASLERLYVSDFDFPCFTGLRELENLAHAKYRFPHLRVIDIEGRWEDESKGIHTLAEPLRRACEDVGVVFSIRYYDIEVVHRGKPEVESEDHWSHQFGDILTFYP